MLKFRYFLLIWLSILLFACDQGNDKSIYNIKELTKLYSPDKRCYLTIIERATDTTGNTQVLVHFKNGGGGVYAVQGINKQIKAWWKDDNTIVVETRKTYRAHQHWPEVQHWNDRIKVEYVYK